MPTNRTRRVRSRYPGEITAEAVDAWREGDYWRLHDALRLRPWQMPSWDDDPPELDDRPPEQRARVPWPDVVVIKAALLEIAGPPPRRWHYRWRPG
jgi:hypothetical protein